MNLLHISDFFCFLICSNICVFSSSLLQIALCLELKWLLGKGDLVGFQRNHLIYSFRVSGSRQIVAFCICIIYMLLETDNKFRNSSTQALFLITWLFELNSVTLTSLQLMLVYMGILSVHPQLYLEYSDFSYCHHLERPLVKRHQFWRKMSHE